MRFGWIPLLVAFLALLALPALLAPTAWNDLDSFGAAQDVLTGGGGIRYEIARRQGIHMGVDVAWGPDETALYVQFGGAWFRP